MARSQLQTKGGDFRADSMSVEVELMPIRGPRTIDIDLQSMQAARLQGIISQYYHHSRQLQHILNMLETYQYYDSCSDISVKMLRGIIFL